MSIIHLCLIFITFEKTIWKIHFHGCNFLYKQYRYLYLLQTIKTGQQSRFFSFSSIGRAQRHLYILGYALTNLNIYLPKHNYRYTYREFKQRCVWPHNAIVHLSSRDNIIIQLPTAWRINVSCYIRFPYYINSLLIAVRLCTLKATSWVHNNVIRW